MLYENEDLNVLDLQRQKALCCGNRTVVTKLVKEIQVVIRGESVSNTPVADVNAHLTSLQDIKEQSQVFDIVG